MRPTSALRRRARGVVLAIGTSVLAACAGAGAFPPIPDVGEVTTVPPIDRRTDDRSGIALPGVGGTTTTVVVMGPGRSRLVGRVDGPDGPLAGGVVRLERLVGDGVAREDVPVAPDGTWNREDLLGGRYRVRAFAAPGFAMVAPEIFFLEDGTRELLLVVERFGDRDVDAVIAPSPPFVDERANLVVRVAAREVDLEGVVRTTPRPGIGVALGGSGGWTVVGESAGVTDLDGEVRFTLVCGGSGPQPLDALLDGTTSVPLGLPACVERAAPTTTTTTQQGTTSTTADGATTSSSSTTTTTTTTTTTDGG